MIKVDKLTKTYDGVDVLKQISLSIKDNEIFGLLGPNGAGKTTTLECMEGLRHFDNGSISINGLSPNQALKKGLIGVQLQNSSLPENINVQDLLQLYCHWQKKTLNHDLIETLKLKPLYEKLYKNLSTGQKRKLHLALALISNPDTVFLDEPTAGLDVQSRHDLHNQIRALKKQGKTIIIASHDMSEVQSLCDRVAILVNGVIHAVDSPNVIISKDNYTNVMEVKFDKKINALDIKHATYITNKGDYQCFQVHDLHSTLEELTKYMAENKVILQDMVMTKPSLEERFIQLTKE